MIGMKKQRDFPEPVPVVTAKLWRAVAFATRLHLVPVKRDRLPVDPKDAGHIRMQRAPSNERLDRGTPLEMRIDA